MLNDQGVETQVNIIFGQDNDTLETFDKTIDFLLENKVSFFYANILFPQPGTTLYKRLQKEGRMLDTHRFEIENPIYSSGEIINLPHTSLEVEDPAFINFVPKNFTAEELVNGTQLARKRFLAERSAEQPFWLGMEKNEYWQVRRNWRRPLSDYRVA